MKEWFWSHAKMLIGIFISTVLLKSGGIVGRIMGTLGLSLITYKYVMPEVKDFLWGYMSAVSGESYNLITYVNFDKAAVMIISAGAVKLASNLMVGKVGT